MQQEIHQIIKEAFLNPLPLNPLPELEPRSLDVPHAPKRNPNLTIQEEKIALKNSLRYFPKELHVLLGKEFYNELKDYGHIYMYRFKPKWRFSPYPFEVFPAKTNQAKCIIHNIWNNLSREVAQFPEELITYVTIFL